MTGRLFLSGCVLLGLLGAAALAQEPSADDIKAALTPRPITRSISRQIAVEEKPPSINLRIGFAYDSAVILPEAISVLDNLATAISDPRFAATRFEIGGHTDARGSEQYNLVLSARRAEAVRDYLVAHARITVSQLVPVGYGKSRLADPEHPEDGVNRRVEIVNLSAASAK